MAILMATWGMAFAHGGKHKSADTGTGASYTRDILPVFENNCASCHGSKSPEHAVFMKNSDEYSSKFVGPRMDNYTLMSSFVVWPDTGSLMRNLDDGTNTENGKPGKMYVHLGGDEQERMMNLKLFKSWVARWTLKDWSDITKEEMGRITLAP
ncbi:hypothetical protein LCGC14_1241140 [marine sediment metagenome]|uniref:Cytochrome c domain-containing protein n=1 Tax=marine sediment metagenome TaxID=412755 RepID=A0A0F9L9U7_9ZZZZ